MSSPTPAELTALRTAHAAVQASPSPNSHIIDTAVFALGAAQLLQSPETAAELVALRARVAELEQAAVAALAPHEKYPDSPHCSADGGLWPCHTVYVLEPVVAPSRDLRSGVGAARRMIRDRQSAEDAEYAEGRAELEAMRSQHPAPCRFPDSPDCTCPTPGDLAEQRHLMDPLDTTLTHLADGGAL